MTLADHPFGTMEKRAPSRRGRHLLAAPQDAALPQDLRAFWDQPGFPNTSEALVTADFAGTSAELLPRDRVVTASSTGTAAGATGGLSWQPARARYARR